MAADLDFAMGILEGIGRMFSSKTLSDFTICIGYSQFSCHKVILCACSEFFRELLYKDPTAEVRSGIKQVNIKGISPQVFAAVLKMVYTGIVTIDQKNVLEIWLVARHLQINILLNKYEDFVKKYMNMTNYLKFYEHAVLFNDKNILKSIFQFIAKNLCHFRKTQQFENMSLNIFKDFLQEAKQLLNNHEPLVEAILQWAKFIPKVGNNEKINEREPASEAVPPIRITSDNVSASGLKCEGNIQESSPENIEKPVEILFSEPCVLPDPMSQSESRWKSVATLLSCISLRLVDKNCLQRLLDCEPLMEWQESRKLVTAAVMAEINYPSLEKPVVAEHRPSMERVAVFLGQNNAGILAYNLTSKQFYKLKSNVHIKDLSVHANELYLYSGGIFLNYSTKTCGDTLSLNLLTENDNVAVVGDAKYLFTFDCNHLNVFKLDAEEIWTQIGDCELKGQLKASFVFNKSIILIVYIISQGIPYTIAYCFNTETRMFND